MCRALRGRDILVGRPVHYLVWTSFWTAFHLIWCAYDAYYFNATWDVHPASWLVFLTNWSYTLITVHSFIDFITACYIFFYKSGTTEEEMPWYMKVNWVIFNLMNTSAILLTLTYWILLAKSLAATSINKHGINALYVILCVSLTAKPIKFQHFYQPAIYNLVYIIFNSVYTLISGDAVYAFLDWGERPVPALVLSLMYVFVCCPVIHLLLYGLYRLRLRIARSCTRASKQPPLPHEAEVEMGMLKKTEEADIDPSDQVILSNGHHKAIFISAKGDV
ncbi:protein rolling stone-like isoform X2 [Mizuhopecten yessoensis]|uniref:protein rolling stone-like isoform X2 n=1 Tax=Mizuhopecten yessoensis TaxID=6573 RepID=UPI000B45D4F7|nr:protein rolling stone-like isoform X2 [Mizuhopecten yessoensis]